MTLGQRDKMARSFQHQAVFFLLLSAVLVNFAVSQEYCRINNWKDAVHPHPVYCDRFVKCYNFQTTITSCPAGTLFDVVSRTCMNAASSTTHCNDASSTATPVTVPPMSQDYCQTNNWRDDAHPHPMYCDRFVKCDNFQTTIVLCPTGTLFDVVSRTCMNAASSTTHCNDAGSTPTPVTVPPIASNICATYQLLNGNYPDPSNCKGYVECSNGVTIHGNCPNGMAFNVASNGCTEVHSVNCNDNANFHFIV